MIDIHTPPWAEPWVASNLRILMAVPPLVRSGPTWVTTAPAEVFRTFFYGPPVGGPHVHERKDSTEIERMSLGVIRLD